MVGFVITENLIYKSQNLAQYIRLCAMAAKTTGPIPTKIFVGVPLNPLRVLGDKNCGVPIELFGYFDKSFSVHKTGFSVNKACSLNSGGAREAAFCG